MDVGEGEILNQAVDTCEGDLRRALTALQCCQRLYGKITADGLIEVYIYTNVQIIYTIIHNTIKILFIYLHPGHAMWLQCQFKKKNIRFVKPVMNSMLNDR